jgi:hypothetical protein
MGADSDMQDAVVVAAESALREPVEPSVQVVGVQRDAQRQRVSRTFGHVRREREPSGRVAGAFAAESRRQVRRVQHCGVDLAHCQFI